jgi:DNA polymerase-3 subunit epsilon
MARSSSTSKPGAAPASAPPEGSPWDLPIDEAPLAFVDLEMTGLDPSADRVIQLCIERVVGGRLESRLSSFVRPEPARAIGDKHGVEPEEIVDAPTFASLAPNVERLLGGAVLIAHAARYDIAFLQAELGREGRSWACPHRLDTLALSRRAFRRESHRLGALAEAFSIPNERPHRADNDVAVLRGVFDRLMTALEPVTPRAMWQASRGRRAASPEILAIALQALELKRPVLMRYRSAGRRTREFQFHIREVRTDLDPPLVLGYLQRTRGRRELRADRILTIELLGNETPA